MLQHSGQALAQSSLAWSLTFSIEYRKKAWLKRSRLKVKNKNKIKKLAFTSFFSMPK